MTFLEAAVEILKREGKPMSVKQLTQAVLKHNLLSVVGRDPELTMDERLRAAMEKPDPRVGLVQPKEGWYGLREYPTKGEEPSVEPAAAEAEPPANGVQAREEKDKGESGGAVDAEKKRRRRGRRGGRGRRKGAAGEAAVETADAEGGADAEEGEPEAVEAGAGDNGAAAEEAGEAEGAEAAPVAAAAEGEAAAAEGERRGRRRSRRGGRGRRKADRSQGEVSESLPEEVSPDGEAEAAMQAADEVATRVMQRPGDLTEDVAAATGALIEEGEAEVEPEELPLSAVAAAEGQEGDALDEELELPEELPEEEFELPGGPVLAPTFGAEEATRTEDDRTVRAEIRGQRRDERGRRFDRVRERREAREKARDKARAERAERAERKEQQPEAREHREPREHREHREGRSSGKGLIDVVLEVLRSGDGRPLHVKQLAEQAHKRNLVDAAGGQGEVVRQLRAALVREVRDREADGLRARVRSLGGGHFALADRKLDQELVPLERELADKAQRLREATHAAVRRRIQRLPPPAFEALCRGLVDKLGITQVELVRRGDGVAYYGGQKQLGLASVKTLIAMRPGEQEIGRRAVGELRAGLQARGYDEGLLFAAGKAGQEGLTELKAGSGVVAHDGASLATLCVRHGLGVRRVQMPIDYLDLELFAELTEQ